MPIKQSILMTESRGFSRTNEIQAALEAKHRKTAFLCHSHKDKDLVDGLIARMQREGVDLYIDSNDDSMPDTPNQFTATKIRVEIKNRDIFLFLATENSKASRWCPWEIGYADSKDKTIYIIPTIDERYNTFGNEYLQLYNRIDIDTTSNKLQKYKLGNILGESMSTL